MRTKNWLDHVWTNKRYHIELHTRLELKPHSLMMSNTNFDSWYMQWVKFFKINISIFFAYVMERTHKLLNAHWTTSHRPFMYCNYATRAHQPRLWTTEPVINIISINITWNPYTTHLNIYVTLHILVTPRGRFWNQHLIRFQQTMLGLGQYTPCNPSKTTTYTSPK